MLKKSGYYFGTDVNGICFWKYVRDNMEAKGRGEYWFGFDGLYFKPWESAKAFVILYTSMKKICSGYFHAGQFGKGHVIVKVKWRSKDGWRLNSGFLFRESRKEVESLIDFYRRQYCNITVKQPC